jgi:hypothetical protein
MTLKRTTMLDDKLKDLPLEELLKLLAVSQRNLKLSQLFKQGTNVIELNKKHLDKVQKAVAERRKNAIPVEQ